MVRLARARRLAPWLASLALVAVLPDRSAAVDLEGDVFVSLENDDADAERWRGEITWMEPLTEWLAGEIGGHYANFDDAHWGFGILGAHVELPGGRDRISARYEHGAGQGSGGDYDHILGRAVWTHAFVRDRIFARAGFHAIRIADVSENLVQGGIGLVPLSRLELKADYYHSVFGGEGTQAWSVRSDVHTRVATLFGGYARSEDTIDLRSIGGSRNTGRATHEIFLGVQVPVGRHAVTLSGTRHRSRYDTRYSVGLTVRWNLFFRGERDAEAEEPPVRGGGGRAYALRQRPSDS